MFCSLLTFVLRKFTEIDIYKKLTFIRYFLPIHLFEQHDFSFDFDRYPRPLYIFVIYYLVTYTERRRCMAMMISIGNIFE